jgi:uncharacterized protein
MSKDLDLTKLQVLKFAQSQGSAQGREPIERFARLMLEQDNALDGQDAGLQAQHPEEGAQIDPAWVDWHLEGFFDPLDPHVLTAVDAKAGFNLEVHAAIKMTCQRCLGVCFQVLDVNRTFRFVRDEQIALAMDDASEDEFLVLSSAFDVLELMEDELIMALPLVPLHAQCPVPLTQQVGDKSSLEIEFESKRPNPFEVLSVLKSKKK